MKKIATAIFSLIIIAGACHAGHVEFNDEVLSTLNDSQYKAVLVDLGGTASRGEIARQYLDNQEKYNSIK